MRHDKAALVIDLARRMAASAEGVTIGEIERDLGVGRRTAERLRDAVISLFPQTEEVSDPPNKRWRIRGGLSAFEQAPTTAELIELTKAAQALRASGEPGRAAALEGLERKLKSAMRSTTLNRLVPIWRRWCGRKPSPCRPGRVPPPTRRCWPRSGRRSWPAGRWALSTAARAPRRAAAAWPRAG
jgi:hypothetical protein